MRKFSLLFKVFLKVSLLIHFALLITLSFAQEKVNKEKKIMLVLGSANLTTLQERVEVAYKLYTSPAKSFDYIIVSGGCGAHGSKICEASEMASLLVKMGIPAEKIKKEEKSNSTVQNYVYSRALKNENGQRVIQAKDSLYVVSNHWHAISVAARFNTYDDVHAVYHIAGKIIPSSKDMVDYVGILHKNTDNEDFIEKSLRPSIDASFTLPNDLSKNGLNFNTVNFRGKMVYLTAVNGESNSLLMSEIYPFLPPEWHEGIDAAFYNPKEKKAYLFKGNQFLSFHPHRTAQYNIKPQGIQHFAKNMPASWQGIALEAAYYNPKDQTIHLFKKDETVQINAKSKTFIATSPLKIINKITNWPFTWGSGDIDASSYNYDKRTITFFRGRDWLEVSLDGKVQDEFPQKIKAVQP